MVTQFSNTQSGPEYENFCFSRHNEHEICIVLSGHSKFMLNNSVYDAEPGTAFMIDSWVSHPFGYKYYGCTIGQFIDFWHWLHRHREQVETVRKNQI